MKNTPVFIFSFFGNFFSTILESQDLGAKVAGPLQQQRQQPSLLPGDASKRARGGRRKGEKSE